MFCTISRDTIKMSKIMKVKKSPQTDIKKCPRLQNLVPPFNFVEGVRCFYQGGGRKSILGTKFSNFGFLKFLKNQKFNFRVEVRSTNKAIFRSFYRVCIFVYLCILFHKLKIVFFYFTDLSNPIIINCGRDSNGIDKNKD